MEASLTSIEEGKEAKIIGLSGGFGLQRRLRTMGIREGKLIRLVTKQPFRGPLVVEVDGREITIGRGMAQKIMVEI